jgi:hypothetical protein
VQSVAQSIGAGGVHADEVALNQITAAAAKRTHENSAAEIARNDIASAGCCAAEAVGRAVERHGSIRNARSLVATRDLSGRVRADEIPLDENIGKAFVLGNLNGLAGKVIDHQTTQNAVAAAWGELQRGRTRAKENAV